MTTAQLPAAGAVPPPPATPPSPPPDDGRGARGGGRLRRVAGYGLVALLAASALVGANVLGVRDRIVPLPVKPPPPVAHGARDAVHPVLASQPYWVGITELAGGGSATLPVTIPASALQWRMRWSCEAGGRLSVRTPGLAGRRRTQVDSSCPGSGVAELSRTGSVPVEVDAGGSWRLIIEAEVDLPVSDPPLAAMTAAGTRVVATGSFYGVDEQGHGRVTVYRLPDGSEALRLEDFYVTPNTDLEIRASSQPEPHSDAAVTGGTVATVVPLPRTAGSMNFAVPPGVEITRWSSLFIWCLRINTVYSAAHLVVLPGPGA